MINIGLVEREQREVSQTLNMLLADEYLLTTKTKNYHRNVTGARFHDLHELFGNQYAKLDVLIDQVAERIRMLGGNAPGTLLEFLKFARLEEHPGRYPCEQGMVEDLCDDHETLIRELRRVLERNADIFCDAGTTDFLTTVMQEHEKMAWILRSILGKHSQLTKWVKDQEQIQRESGIEVPVLSSAI